MSVLRKARAPGMARPFSRVFLPAARVFMAASAMAGLCLFPSPDEARSGTGSEKPVVFVSVAPQRYFVRRIAADTLDVRIMAPPGASPATYEPRPRQMAALSKAKIYFAIGVPFEKIWLKKIAASNPDMRIVDTSAGVEKKPMDVFHDHHHGHDHESGAPGVLMDPHIWTSPPLVAKQARHILAALGEMDPGRRPFYEKNAAAFIKRLEELDADFRKIFKKSTGMGFMVFHPSWGYFARAYGLRQIPVEVEGKEPKAPQLKQLILKAGRMGVKVIFAQPQFSSKSAERVAREIGARVVFADPLAENWFQNMRETAAKFQQAAREESPK
ncbi:Cation ABC transporter substrate-binding protein [Candidatus Desulfarcum epimagneticum]|uniref:Cation ABC transporter substrate-binding protein n=1 Tax=uncultured Desulfobacteraceae bacterium TaxID=218296 RepID=A0A484HDI4_9BACT|nr:Cation ABC transporter substrate-binding protein [uncultured Desulfobacteraceae bacterium]